MFSFNFRKNALALLSLSMLGYSQMGMAGSINLTNGNSCSVMERVCPCGKTASCTQSCEEVCNSTLSWITGSISVLFNGSVVNGDMHNYFLDRYRKYGNNDPLYHYECYGAICSSLSAVSGSLKVTGIEVPPISKIAIPDSGYSFLGWYGSCSGNSKVFEVTVESSKAASCKFNQLPIPPATITGKVFNDLNGNGVRDANESGLPNWAVTSNVLVNGKNQDSKGNTYNRTVITNGTGDYTLGACNPQKDAQGQYNAAEVQKCLTLSGLYTVGIEQKSGWTSTTPNPFEQFDLNASISATNTIDYESYADLEFGVFNGYILKTAVPSNGAITSSDSKINCSTTSKVCQAGFPANSSVTLTAKPATGYFFNQWAGNCSGTNPSVTLKMDASKSCSATFVKAVSLNVGINNGDAKMNMNTITSQPIGISCSVGGVVTPDCKEEYPLNQSVVLTATPSTGYVFMGWSGSCSGTALTTTVKMDAAKTCIANFSPAFNLTVSKTGNGTITGTGINCGTDCSEFIAANTNVTLTATPNNGNYFSNWTGACTGSSTTCTVTMATAKTASAVFKPLVAKKFDSSTLDFSVSSGRLKGRKCETRETEVCLPTSCTQLDKSGDHPNGYKETRYSMNNQGDGSGVNLSSYTNSKGETCSKLRVEVCAKAFTTVTAWYKGSTTIYGLCKQ